MAAMGGMDGLVFTAGIGERGARDSRRGSATRCAWLGLEFDPPSTRRTAADLDRRQPDQGR